jgi:dTDP-4-dehydrorhamnose reductase
MKKTVLIFGISSFLGSNLAQLLEKEYRIIGTYYKNPVNYPGMTCYPCDVLKKDSVNNLTAFIRPDFIIYAVGMNSLSSCMKQPKLADALNTAGAINVCVSSDRYNAKFIFFSSAYVMGGEDVFYKENETPFPNSIYGNSLASTEFYVQRSCLNYLILRCSNLYGLSYLHLHPNWFEIIQMGYIKEQPIMANDVVQGGFLDVHLAGKILMQLLKSNVTNRLLHISSSDYCSRFQFAQAMAQVFKKDQSLIQKHLSEFPLLEGTIKSTNNKDQNSVYSFKLDVSNLEQLLGQKMPSIEDSLMYTYKRLSGFTNEKSSL